MKVGILTLHLEGNYGGILQNFALQQALLGLGHEPVTLRVRPQYYNWLQHGYIFLDRLRARYLRHERIKRLREWSRSERHYLLAENRQFVEEEIRLTPEILPEALPRLNQSGFDAFIVGSDQVWRSLYNGPTLPRYFFDFLGADCTARKIAYAASLGTDCWEADTEMTARCAELAQRFDAISVRETSGVALCREHLRVSAVQMPDPTILLESAVYRKLFAAPSPGRELFCYILDDTPEKLRLAEEAAARMGLTIGTIRCFDRVEGIFRPGPPVPGPREWLKRIAGADYVLTDSFHGTVFSILFGKPFAVIANPGRGVDRLQSFLMRLGLADRLITPGMNLPPPEYDLADVQVKLLLERKRGLAFLQQALAAKSLQR